MLLFSYFEKGCRKKLNAEGNVGYNQYTVPDTVAVFCCVLLALANIRPWPLATFFQISLKNSELKTTHNTFQDCREHFFRQTFSK